MFSFSGKISQAIAVDFQPPLSGFSNISFFIFETVSLLGNQKLMNLKISENFDMKMEMMEMVQLT